MFTPTLRSLFVRLPCTRALPSLLPRASLLSPTHTIAATRPQPAPLPRAMHTTAPQGAKGGAKPARGGKTSSKKRKKGKGKGEGPDPRVLNLKSSMPRAMPAPLRFARNRALRHWTIHRAWLLYQRKERDREAHELERMYNSMHTACEELRKSSGPGSREEGYLYRVAVEKHGVFGHDGVPIEYARMQTETPAREPWNHGWTR
ncbi:hypothetical protein F4781DRAFT_133611 [Annulohypoxylon bovei var. microspora]|nr:hypothetical protein F4781DRAFT_133611 [Annulohypoxylon bovei var. microspora]